MQYAKILTATSVASDYIKEFYANYIARLLCRLYGRKETWFAILWRFQMEKGLIPTLALLPHLISQQCIIRWKCWATLDLFAVTSVKTVASMTFAWSGICIKARRNIAREYDVELRYTVAIRADTALNVNVIVSANIDLNS